jgi:hypothetical protein
MSAFDYCCSIGRYPAPLACSIGIPACRNFAGSNSVGPEVAETTGLQASHGDLRWPSASCTDARRELVSKTIEKKHKSTAAEERC